MKIIKRDIFKFKFTSEVVPEISFILYFSDTPNEYDILQRSTIDVLVDSLYLIDTNITYSEVIDEIEINESKNN